MDERNNIKEEEPKDDRRKNEGEKENAIQRVNVKRKWEECNSWP